MPGISRAFQDSAGGTILSGASNVRCNGSPVALLLSPVSGHGKDAHSGPYMLVTQGKVRANGLPIVTAGSPASCGHVASGSGNVRIG